MGYELWKYKDDWSGMNAVTGLLKRAKSKLQTLYTDIWGNNYGTNKRPMGLAYNGFHMVSS